MESLLQALLTPVPLGRVRNPSLASGAGAPSVVLEGGPLRGGRREAALYFDPAATLASSMRALHIVRQASVGAASGQASPAVAGSCPVQ